MPVNFTVIGRVVTKVGPANRCVATTLYKDSDETLQEIEFIYWEDPMLFASGDTVYLISGTAVLCEQPEQPPKVCAMSSYEKKSISNNIIYYSSLQHV